jgi:hypothetical protein
VLDIIFDVQEHLFALRNDGLPATPQEAGA